MVGVGTIPSTDTINPHPADMAVGVGTVAGTVAGTVVGTAAGMAGVAVMDTSHRDTVSPRDPLISTDCKISTTVMLLVVVYRINRLPRPCSATGVAILGAVVHRVAAMGAPRLPCNHINHTNRSHRSHGSHSSHSPGVHPSRHNRCSRP